MHLPNFRQHRSHQKSSQSHAESQMICQNRTGKNQSEDRDQKHLLHTCLTRDLDQSGHKKKSHHRHRHKKSGQFEEIGSRPRPTHLSRSTQTRQHSHHRNRQNIFHNEHSENQTGKARSQQPHALQNLGNDRRGRNGKNRPQKDRIHRAPAEDSSQTFPQEEHSRDLHHSRHHRHPPHLL